MYPGNGDSEVGDRGEGNRSSSRRSLSPFLKAMMDGHYETEMTGLLPFRGQDKSEKQSQHGIKLNGLGCLWIIKIRGAVTSRPGGLN